MQRYNMTFLGHFDLGDLCPPRVLFYYFETSFLVKKSIKGNRKFSFSEKAKKENFFSFKQTKFNLNGQRQIFVI